MRPVPITLVLWGTACGAAGSPTSTLGGPPDPATTAIAAVQHAFERAIVAHDGAAIEALLLTPDAPFLARRAATGAAKALTGAAFARDVAGGRGWEERFADVTITPRGGLAVLDAGYGFFDHGVRTNHGREVWILLESAGGWKIASVTWTVELD
jgi:hypothetical protein